MSLLKSIEKNWFWIAVGTAGVLWYRTSSKGKKTPVLSPTLVTTPPTPVVTKGYFAGAPRPLYHVGAPPPGGDYSFTRRPGYNGKDY